MRVPAGGWEGGKVGAGVCLQEGGRADVWGGVRLQEDGCVCECVWGGMCVQGGGAVNGGARGWEGKGTGGQGT